jgi:hypothetical protein
MYNGFLILNHSNNSLINFEFGTYIVILFAKSSEILFLIQFIIHLAFGMTSVLIYHHILSQNRRFCNRICDIKSLKTLSFLTHFQGKCDRM